MFCHVFLTGPPGIGKTTLIRKVSEVLISSGVPVDGFYTEEVRQGHRRVGFDVVTISGNRGKLARISGDANNDRCRHRVGQYVVDISSFEQLVLPLMDPFSSTKALNKRVCVIDEIGKMELFSQPFTSAVGKVLDNPSVVVLGTLPVSKGRLLPFVEEIRHRQDVKLFNVTKQNRDEIVHEIVTSIEECRIEKSK
ncbi:cancer-related nucleoside-triphosphatase isoform X2 [Eleutherodactylus coqui]|uniref:cancer-related nucleoside-triphosphatase isoform X2 n=1 Tax=Eleutherodactylus coqui TaxID=57060 RepID=UPI0034629A3E